MKKVLQSFRHINHKLYFALIVLGLCPTIYTTVRVFFLGQLPGDWTFSIAGQLSWVNLIYEVINEAIILPLFFFIAKVKDDKKEFSNRVRTGMLVSLGIYAFLSIIIFVFAEQLLALMATDTDILAASATYIRIESVANIFNVLAQFMLVALVSINKSRYIYILTTARLLLSLSKGHPSDSLQGIFDSLPYQTPVPTFLRQYLSQIEYPRQYQEYQPQNQKNTCQ